MSCCIEHCVTDSAGTEFIAIYNQTTGDTVYLNIETATVGDPVGAITRCVAISGGSTLTDTDGTPASPGSAYLHTADGVASTLSALDQNDGSVRILGCDVSAELKDLTCSNGVVNLTTTNLKTNVQTVDSFGFRLAGASTFANPSFEIDAAEALAVGDVVYTGNVTVTLPVPVLGVWAHYTAQVTNNLEDGAGVSQMAFRMFLGNPVTATFPNSFFENDYLTADVGSAGSPTNFSSDVPFNNERFFPYSLPAGVHTFPFEYRVTASDIQDGFVFLNQITIGIQTVEGVCV